MLLQSVAHKGSWWVAGSDERVPGVLEYSPERGTRLTLNGTFESKTFRSFGGAEVRHEIILGTTSLGKYITLVDCVEDDFTVPIGNEDAYADSTYRVRLTFIGEHFSKIDDIRFSSVFVGAPNLTTFVGTTGIGPGSAPSTPHEVNLKIVPAEEFSFPAGDFQVETFHQQNFERGGLNQISVAEEVVVEVSVDTPRTLEDFLDGPVRSLHTLLELVSDGPLPMSELRGRSPAKNDIMILRSQRRPREIEELSQPEMMPFTLKSLGGDRNATLARWHNARQTFGPTFDLYFSVMRNSEMPVEHQFLFLVQAVETFHRRTGSNQLDDPKEHAHRLLETFFSVPARLHEWLCRMIGEHSNEPRLVHRLRAVYDLMPAKVQELLGEKKRFARIMTDTRNYLTHFNEDLKPRALTEVGELWGGNQQLAAILRMLFIQTLGLDQSKVLETVWGNHLLQRLQQAARQQAKTATSVP